MLRRIGSLYRNLFRKDVVEGELDEELHSCLEILTQGKLDQAMDAQEARRQARLELGRIEQIKEQVREVRAGALIQDLWQDLRYGARMLSRSPGFTTVAVLSLALVIGANSTIFSVLNPILFHSLPYEEPNRIVLLREVKVDQPRQWRTPTTSGFSEWRRQAQSFEQMALVTPYPQGVTISARGQAEPGFYNRVSSTFFPLLGVEPQLGRTFTSEDPSHEAGEPVLLSDSYWRRRFGADPDVLGEQMLVAGQINIIVGVLPPGFRFRISLIPREPHVWQSVSVALQQGAGRWFNPLARLKPGISVEQARLELEAISQHLEERDSTSDESWRPDVRLLPDVLFASWKESLFLLSGIALLVLLIGCANVANLLLARARKREKEISIRISMGASRLRLIRQLLTESILLAALGGILGLFFTFWGIGFFVALAPEWWPFAQEGISIDGRVLAFAAVVSLLTGVIFGLAPALRTSRPNLYESLKEGGRRSTGSDRTLLRNLLIVSEVSLTLILLVGAGLMVRSFMNLQRVDPGYDPTNLLRAQIFLQGPEYWERQEGHGMKVGPQADRFWEELLQRSEALPGVQSAAIDGFAFPACGFQIVGRSPTPTSQRRPVFYHTVSPRYFRTLGVPVVRGRTLTEQDTEGSRWVAVINEAGAKQLFPEEDPLGKLVQLDFGSFGPRRELNAVDEPQSREIVGVVGDARTWGLASRSPPQLYVPHLQHMWVFPGQGSAASVTRKDLFVRAASRPLSLKPMVERVIAEIDPDQTPSYIWAEEQHLSDSLQPWRFWMRLFLFFAAVAVILVVVGVFGVISSAVSERTHEMGVRMAIGAQQRDVFVLVIKQGLKVTLIGLAIGIAASLGLSRLLVSLRLPPCTRSVPRIHSPMFWLPCCCWGLPWRPATFRPAGPRGWIRWWL